MRLGKKWGGTIEGGQNGVNIGSTGYVFNAGSTISGEGNNGVNISGDGSVENRWSGVIGGNTNGVAIAGATASTLTLAQAQVGQTISVKASYTDLFGTAENVTSLATTAVAGLVTTPQTFISTAANETFTAVTTNDTVSYVNATAGVKVSLLSTVAQNNVAAGMGSDTLVGIANLIGGGFNDTLTGNNTNNALSGGAGNDTLVGGLGDDNLTGGLGLDRFTVASGIDTITDLGAGGVDILTIDAGATANATVTAAWKAAVTTTNSGVANITTNGLAVNLAAVITGTGSFNVTNTGIATTLTGSGLVDTLTGGTGNDTVLGGAGNDMLIGKAGNDSLTGGAGSDTFWFDTAANATTNRDTITDFVSGTDKLQFSVSALTALGTIGQFIANDPRFWSSATGVAHDLDDRLIYNTASGILSYDSDGTGAVAAVQLELLGAAKHPTIVSTDIFIV